MNNPSISVIVPIYQSEATLRRCLDSIQSQTFTDIEVLLVDDGSTDKSADICEEYVQKDNRFHLFRKPHSGVSDTRQMGLDNASGEYVIHCDSDDWMEANMLELLYLKAKETDADMVVCDYYRKTDKATTIHYEFPHGLKPNKPIGKQIKDLSNCMWNKFIKLSVLRKNNISFPKGMLMGEDVYVTFSLLNKFIKIEYLPQSLYYYDHTLNHNNVSAIIAREGMLSNIKIIRNLESVLDKSLYVKLVSQKKYVFIQSYNNGLLTAKEYLGLFPKAHNSWIITILKNRTLILFIFKCILFNFHLK